MIVTATQLQLKDIGAFFRFLIRIRKISAQVKRATGLVFVKTKGFKTLSGWKDYEAMKNFRNSGPHLEAMQNIHKMGTGKSVTWESDVVPTWQEAEERLRGSY